MRRFHAARAIPDDVSWATLAELGQNMAIYQQRYDAGGLSAKI